MDTYAVALQIFAAFYMTGVIWLIQLIHYPAFGVIEAAAFPAFHRRHSNVMTLVVGPVMLVELGTAVWLARGFEAIWILNLASVVFAFVMTFAVSVPLHDQLGRINADPAVCRRLVLTNWPRTMIWTLRSAGFLGFLLSGRLNF